MTQAKLLLLNTLLVSGLFTVLAYSNAQPCKSIDVSIEKIIRGERADLVLDIKGKNPNDFTINLIMPKGKRMLDAKTLEFGNLEPGDYIVVVTSRKEGDEYCPTYVNVSIE